MKFSKSERTIHQNNYNPPCNVYQHIDKPNNKILIDIKHQYQSDGISI